MPLKRDTHFPRLSTLIAAVLACLLMGLVGSHSALPAAAAPASDPSGLEAQLFSQLQQDRWQQGLSGFVQNGTLGAYARGAGYQPCPGVVANGRAEDMVERNYFSHQVPPCGGTVFPAIQAAGLPMQAWGENIAWSEGSGAASPGVVNAGFMASAGHRANILGNFNSVGIGASAAPGAWTGGGGARSGVIVFSVLFARVPGVAGPGAPPAPPPAPPPPVVEAPPAPPPAPPPPQAPDPAPASQVLDSTSEIHAAERHLVLPPLSATPGTAAARVPALIGWLAIYLLLGMAPSVALATALRARRRSHFR